MSYPRIRWHLLADLIRASGHTRRHRPYPLAYLYHGAGGMYSRCQGFLHARGKLDILTRLARGSHSYAGTVGARTFQLCHGVGFPHPLATLCATVDLSQLILLSELPNGASSCNSGRCHADLWGKYTHSRELMYRHFRRRLGVAVVQTSDCNRAVAYGVYIPGVILPLGHTMPYVVRPIQIPDTRL
ncbi:hypothetical protein GQ53DRAFT_348550 [Thozetella sp. PMI_491]|nr:hypothetical protein GQ53DRAFT_348550 [Thozetella sp. PMI_491]